ncbi:MAG TPA: HAMP domain-containing sensor histidine kinase, partial [Rhodanobacteraceae bacterium]
GPGISEEMLPVIFDPFVTTKAPNGAGGVGLTIVRQIVERLGGQVRVRSKSGAGAVFTVVLPVQARGAAA